MQKGKISFNTLNDEVDDDIVRERVKSHIIIEIPLCYEDVEDFKRDLETLCAKYVDL